MKRRTKITAIAASLAVVAASGTAAAAMHHGDNDWPYDTHHRAPTTRWRPSATSPASPTTPRTPRRRRP